MSSRSRRRARQEARPCRPCGCSGCSLRLPSSPRPWGEIETRQHHGAVRQRSDHFSRAAPSPAPCRSSPRRRPDPRADGSRAAQPQTPSLVPARDRRHDPMLPEMAGSMLGDDGEELTVRSQWAASSSHEVAQRRRSVSSLSMKSMSRARSAASRTPVRRHGPGSPSFNRRIGMYPPGWKRLAPGQHQLHQRSRRGSGATAGVPAASVPPNPSVPSLAENDGGVFVGNAERADRGQQRRPAARYFEEGVASPRTARRFGK